MTQPKVVLLCGGKGTRLEELAETTPKPLVQVGGMPIVWHIMKGYAHHGFTDFILCTGYMREKFDAWLNNYQTAGNHTEYSRDSTRILHRPRKPDWTVINADTGLEALTGERVLNIKKHLEDAPYFLCTYGDGVSDVNIRDIIAFHEKHKPVATVMGAFPPSRFGELSVNDDGLVTEYKQKPKLKTPVNTGFMVLDRTFLDHLKPGSMIEDPFPQLAAEGKLRAYRHEGFWQYMDTQQELNLLRRHWDSGKAPWKVWND
jgi:glucose-1-phosphate cytidylyltransferase